MRATRARWLVVLAVLCVPAVYVLLRYGLPVIAWFGFGAAVELGNYNDYVVSGAVFTEDGTPLDGVTIDVQKARKRKMGVENDYESSYVKIGHSFEISADNCDALYLHFLRKGYEMETLSFTQGGTHRNVQVILREKPSPVTQAVLPEKSDRLPEN